MAVLASVNSIYDHGKGNSLCGHTRPAHYRGLRCHAAFVRCKSYGNVAKITLFE